MPGAYNPHSSWTSASSFQRNCCRSSRQAFVLILLNPSSMTGGEGIFTGIRVLFGSEELPMSGPQCVENGFESLARHRVR